MKQGIGLFIAVALMLLCGGAAAAQEPVKTFVSILPQAYFVEQIGGHLVDVDVLVGPGQSPATYEPTPKQMARLGRSQIYFRIGTPFEKGFIDTISSTFKNVEVIDTRRGVPLRRFVLDAPEDGHGAHAQRGGIDPHIWLDPMRVKIQAVTICQALCNHDPAHSSTYVKNLQAFLQALDAIDVRVAAVLAPFTGQKIFVFHPAFGYFCDAYGLTQIPIETEGKEPSPKQLAGLINRAQKDGVKFLFVQPQFAGKSPDAIARVIGGTVVPLNPLPRDYIANLERMAEAIGGSMTAP